MCLLLLLNKCKHGESSSSSSSSSPSSSAALKPRSMVEFKTQFGRNMACVMVVGLGGALDFVMSLMSIQALWYIVGGEPSLYGLAFGSYDLAAVFFAPLFGWMATRMRQFRVPLLLGVALQLVGNVLYGLALYADSERRGLGWQFLLAGRLLAGAGSCVLNLGSAYITKHTFFHERFGALGSYRVWQTVARMVGPMVGFLFLGLPSPSATSPSSTALLVLNFYTMPGWIAALFSLVSWLVVAVVFKDKIEPRPHPDGEEHNKIDDDNNQHAFVFSSKQLCQPGTFTFGVAINSIVQLLFGFANWAVVCQLWGLAFAQYKVIDSQSDAWKPFTGLGAGAVAAVLFWKKVTVFRRHPETRYSVAGTVLLVASCLCLFPYEGMGATEPEALLYAGAVLVGGASSWFFSNQEIMFSKQLSHSRAEVGSSTILFMSLYGGISSLARFLGPFVGGYAFAIQGPGGSAPCETAECCVSADEYVSTTCAFAGANFMIPVLAALALLAAVLNAWYSSALLGYRKDAADGQPPAAAEQQV